MVDYWITTHWPSVEPGDSPTRHVFFKTGKRRHLPQPGDIALIYESKYAVVEGKLVTQTYICHHGQRAIRSVPIGRSAIVSKMVVVGRPRAIEPSDTVQDYGNLNDWSIIPCTGQTPVHPLFKAEMMELLGRPRETPPRFLLLWRIPDADIAQRIMERLENR